MDEKSIESLLRSSQVLTKNLTSIVSIRNEISRNLIKLSYSEKPTSWFHSDLLSLMGQFRDSVKNSIIPYSVMIDIIGSNRKLVDEIDGGILKTLPEYRFGLIPSYDFDLLLSTGLSQVEVVELVELPLYYKDLLPQLIEKNGLLGILKMGKGDLSKLLGTEKAPAEKEFERHWKLSNWMKKPEWLKAPEIPDWFNRENAWKAIKIIGGGTLIGADIVGAVTTAGAGAIIAVPSCVAGTTMISEATLKKKEGKNNELLAMLNKQLIEEKITEKGYLRKRKLMGI